MTDPQDWYRDPRTKELEEEKWILEARISVALAIAEKAYAAGDLAGAVTPMVLALKGEGE